jgi:branched-chain amino acid aminotransferase
LTWSAGRGPRGLLRPRELAPVLIATAAPIAVNDTPVNLAVSSILRNETAPSARFKTLSRIDNVMALIEAERAGADEAVQFNTQGALAGGAFSNVFVVIDGQIRAPAESDGALAGTVRGALIEQGLAVKIGRIDRSQFARAEAACITNALQPCRIVARLDGRALATNHPLLGPLRAASIDAP